MSPPTLPQGGVRAINLTVTTETTNMRHSLDFKGPNAGPAARCASLIARGGGRGALEAGAERLVGSAWELQQRGRWLRLRWLGGNFPFVQLRFRPLLCHTLTYMIDVRPAPLTRELFLKGTGR